MRHAWLFPIALVTLFIGCAAEAPPPEEAEEAPAAEEYMGSVEADPAHYAVEFENDAVRLVRVSYGPGEASVPAHQQQQRSRRSHPHRVQGRCNGGSRSQLRFRGRRDGRP